MIAVVDTIAESVGAFTRESVIQLGAVTRFFMRIMRAMPGTAARFHLIIEQMMVLGVKTIPIVLLTSAFVGLVSAWQVQYLFSDVMPLTYLGTAVGKAVFTELGPVLTALVITGRVGARLAAELGTMRVTEQIDAMTCLSLDPYRYLLAPRMAAGAVMVPVLTIFSAFFSIISAQLLSQFAMGLDQATFYHGLKMLFRVQDVVICLVKAFVFGVSISLSGCYFGFFTTGGAVGVGESTKKAVVAAMVLILVSNLIVVNILL
ncbi:MAG: ABC transporter permease [Chitinispirillaceae bacterium]|nr:ABC transporter permease [Chitinispirillaceae bacterium]